MRVTTKEVLQWNPETENYDSVLLESHNYEGEVDECAKWDRNWWWGDNSLWGKITGFMPEKGSVSYQGAKYSWDQPVDDIMAAVTGGDEEDYLKLGFMALAVYVIVKMVNK